MILQKTLIATVNVHPIEVTTVADGLSAANNRQLFGRQSQLLIYIQIELEVAR